MTKNMHNLTIFAERLKELMEDNNYNTLSLEKSSGINNSNISNWLNQKVVPSTKNLITLSACLNSSIDFLVGRAELSYIKDTQITASFSERLDKLSADMGKTLHAIAKQLKIDETILYRWRRTKLVPNIDGLIMLADYFGCSVDYLLGRQE